MAATAARRARAERREAFCIGGPHRYRPRPRRTFGVFRAYTRASMAGRIGIQEGFALGPRERERRRPGPAEAVRRPRRRGEALATITVALPAGADPIAIAAASRRPGEAWFSFEQPDRERFALAALG